MDAIASALPDARVMLGADVFELASRKGSAMMLDHTVCFALDSKAGPGR